MWDSFTHLGPFNRDSDPLPRYVFQQVELKVLDDATCRFFGMGISMGTIFAIDITDSSSAQFPILGHMGSSGQYVREHSSIMLKVS